MQVNLYYYIKKNGMTIQKFAELVGCRRECMGKIIHGKKTPSALLAAVIEKVTNGEVKAEELTKPS